MTTDPREEAIRQALDTAFTDDVVDKAIRNFNYTDSGIRGFRERLQGARWILRDAAIAALLPVWPAPEPEKTCATCRHWCAGKWQGESMREFYVRDKHAAECGKMAEFRKMTTIYVYGDGRVDDFEFDTPPDFGCKFHEPTSEAPHE